MISTAELLDWMKADDADAPTLRSLEQAAVKAVETITGRCYGITQTITEIIRFRGFPLALSNDPIGGVITTLEQWNSNAWAVVATDAYYVYGSLVFSSGVWSTLLLTRFRATYQAGYAVDPLDTDVWAAPADVQQAVKLLVGHWFENREASVTGTIQTETEFAVKMLLEPHMRVVA